MFPAAIMSNSTYLSEEEATISSSTRCQDFGCLNPIPMVQTISSQQPQNIKKKRNLPGNPDPDAEVIALSPKTLLATNRFVCEICNKGFQRDQNLQLHRRGHNLPWKLKQRNSRENRKRVYVCPEPTCVHHHPCRALGDLTGIKKHFCRKHGEKKWKCEKCSKIYAVQSDWKAHSRTCGTREYRCDCGTLFSRKDSFITHRAFCDALAEESARLSANSILAATTTPPNLTTCHHPFSLHPQIPSHRFPFSTQPEHQQQQQLSSHFSLSPSWIDPLQTHPSPTPNPSPKHNPGVHIKPEAIFLPTTSPFYPEPPPSDHKSSLMTSPFMNIHVSTPMASSSASSASLSATALLQKAATVGAQPVGHVPCTLAGLDMEDYLNFNSGGRFGTWQKSDRLTRDFLGLTRDECGSGGGGGGDTGNGGGEVDVIMKVRNPPPFTDGVELPMYERDHSLMKRQRFGFPEVPAAAASPATWGNC